MLSADHLILKWNNYVLYVMAFQNLMKCYTMDTLNVNSEF